jgi:hypothetical protein
VVALFIVAPDGAWFLPAFTFYPLPSVFAALRRDRAEAKGEGGQERKEQTTVLSFQAVVRQTQMLVIL